MLMLFRIQLMSLYSLSPLGSSDVLLKVGVLFSPLLNALLLFWVLIDGDLLGLEVVSVFKESHLLRFNIHRRFPVKLSSVLLCLGLVRNEVLLCNHCRWLGIIIVCVLNHYINVNIFSYYYRYPDVYH